jgi:hypothetical protein
MFQNEVCKIETDDCFMFCAVCPCRRRPGMTIRISRSAKRRGLICGITAPDRISPKSKRAISKPTITGSTIPPRPKSRRKWFSIRSKRYNQRSKIFDTEGHLLGAIIASLRAYEKDHRSGKYACIILFIAPITLATFPCLCITPLTMISMSSIMTSMTASWKTRFWMSLKK